MLSVHWYSQCEYLKERNRALGTGKSSFMIFNQFSVSIIMIKERICKFVSNRLRIIIRWVISSHCTEHKCNLDFVVRFPKEMGGLKTSIILNYIFWISVYTKKSQQKQITSLVPYKWEGCFFQNEVILIGKAPMLITTDYYRSYQLYIYFSSVSAQLDSTKFHTFPVRSSVISTSISSIDFKVI